MKKLVAALSVGLLLCQCQQSREIRREGLPLVPVSIDKILTGKVAVKLPDSLVTLALLSEVKDFPASLLPEGIKRLYAGVWETSLHRHLVLVGKKGGTDYYFLEALPEMEDSPYDPARARNYFDFQDSELHLRAASMASSTTEVNMVFAWKDGHAFFLRDESGKVQLDDAALRKQAEEALERGDIAEAVLAYNSLQRGTLELGIGMKVARKTWQVADKYQEQGEYHRAASLIGTALNLYPLENLLAQMSSHSDKYLEAKLKRQKSRASFGEWLYWLNQYTGLLIRTGKAKEALAISRLVLRHQPQSEQAWLHQGEAWLEKGQADSARYCYLHYQEIMAHQGKSIPDQVSEKFNSFLSRNQ
jgi:tetratricopeptide (TPR) repeat protein